MNQARTFLLIAWMLVGYLVWDTWQQDYHRPQATPPAQSAPVAEQTAAVPDANGDLPEFKPVSGQAAEPAVEAAAASGQSRRVTIHTDLLELEVDTRGASIVTADLLAYRQQATGDAPPVRLLDTAASRYFIAQAGYVGSRAELPNHLSNFQVDADSFRLAEGQDSLEVPFSWEGANGLRLVRTLRLSRGSYAIEVQDRFENISAEPASFQAYRQLLRVQPPALPGSSFTNPAAYSFVGAAWYSPQGKFDKLKFADFKDEPLDLKDAQGWVAMLEHYFFAAWIPQAEEIHEFSTGIEASDRYRVRALGPVLELSAGGNLQNSARLYIGPKLQDQLEGIAPGLKLTLDYGIFTVLAQPMAWLLGTLHDLTGNWGWAIVLLVVLLKAGLFKLSEAQYKSFAKMRAVQPRIEALKERYGEDRQKFQTAMMELYKKEKINPMGGCLPILIQIPIFISLYWVLIEAVELRHAPWILWIQNLTAPDPYFILPVLNLLTMWATQKLSPTPGMDPVQKRIMQIMPIAFGVMFAFFPAGLVLYWTTNGALGLLQQWVITRRHSTAAAPTKG
jgi:YidC/Oxa1 family membrane protein insertase